MGVREGGSPRGIYGGIVRGGGRQRVGPVILATSQLRESHTAKSTVFIVSSDSVCGSSQCHYELDCTSSIGDYTTSCVVVCRL